MINGRKSEGKGNGKAKGKGKGKGKGWSREEGVVTGVSMRYEN
jgi:hypothetical protein